MAKTIEIPYNVAFDTTIPHGAKLLYGVFDKLKNGDGYCVMSNKKLADLFSVSRHTISIWVHDLETACHIDVYNENTSELNDATERRIFPLEVTK